MLGRHKGETCKGERVGHKGRRAQGWEGRTGG